MEEKGGEREVGIGGEGDGRSGRGVDLGFGVEGFWRHGCLGLRKFGFFVCIELHCE